MPDRRSTGSRSSCSGLYVLTGAPGSGKTSLLDELAGLGFTRVDEPARRVIAEQRAATGMAVYETDPRLFLDLMLSEALADVESMRAHAPGPVFFDRGVPDLIGYAELFGLDSSAAADAANSCRYNGLVFCLPGWPEIYVTDGDRRMSFEAADAFGSRVRDIYVELGYSVLDVPRDTVEARARSILDALGRDP
jgi:predicted ATPase